MPFINVKTNKQLDPSQIEKMKSDMGKAISIFPGKSEAWLMCEVEGGRNVFFQGSSDDCAFIEVMLFGSVDKKASEKFTSEVCKMLEDYGIPSGRVYIRYEGGTDWGWNGSNF